MKKDLAAIQNDAWAQMAAILSVPSTDQETFSMLNLARYEWIQFADNPENIEPSAEMKRSLEETAEKALELRILIKKVRNYAQLQMLLTLSHRSTSGDSPNSPFSDQQLETLGHMYFFAEHTSKNLIITRGSKGDTPRRSAWIAAAEIYEKATGKPAYYSMNSQQEIDGPFTRYLMAFCRFCFPANHHDVKSIEAFCKWMKRVRQSGGHPSLQVLGLHIPQT